MDDPWAGPSWSTPSKPTSSINMTMPAPGRNTPPPRFDDSDPWGSQPQPTQEHIPGTPEDHDTEKEAKKEVIETLGWGGADHKPWGAEKEEVVSSPVRESSPKAEVHTQEQPSWGSNSSPVENDSSLPEPPTQEQTKPTPPQQQSPSLTQPTPPTISSPTFASSPTSHPIPTFEETPFASTSTNLSPIPKSPSFGDDFGGFSAGPAFTSSGGDDPWGNNTAGPSTTTAAKGGSGGWGNDQLPTWGGGKDDNSWGGDMSFGDEGETSFKSNIMPQSHEEDQQDDEDDGEGWGGSRTAVPVISNQPKGDDDWEEAQRRIKVKQERAPQDKVDGLTKAWTELLGSLIHTDLEKMTGAEEMQFEEKVKKLDDDVVDRLRSLSTIPPNINTYPPVLSTLMTHERFTYALQRPNPAPSTSLLTTTTSRRPTRVDPLALASSSPEPSWTSRSMLGEPDAPKQDDSASLQEDQNKSRWSFWGRRPVPERQLTTSGGGVLERKSTSITSPDPNNERPSADISIKPSSGPSSRAPSISVQPSRPSSPAPPPPPPPISQSAISDNHNDTGHSTPSGSLPQSQPIQSGPSAVSRFFGRLSRNKSSSNSTHTQEIENDKDLELSADDFSFLSEVPSITSPPQEKGIGDLLALEPGRNEQIASLESLLSSKATPLPKPLAPPPKGPSVSPGLSLGNGTRVNSGKFVARMKSPPPTDMDLLGGLDFDGSNQISSSQVQSPTVQSPIQSISSPSNAWEDFLSLDAGSSKSNLTSTVKSPSTPIIAPPLVPSRSSTPTVSLSPPPLPNQSIVPPTAIITNKLPPSTPANKGLSSDFGDFDDFGTPQHASTSTFDDFGDFSAFENSTTTSIPPSIPNSGTTLMISTKPLPLPVPFGIPNQTQTPNKSSALSTPGHGPGQTSLSTPINHTRPGSLDHTPTLNLLVGASASKGKRWPAPPSPIAPVLAPPPKASNQSSSNPNNSFPFLSPPPPGRPNSRSNNLLDETNPPPPQSTSSPGVGIGIGMVVSTSNNQNQSIFGDALQPSITSTPTQNGQKASTTTSAISPQQQQTNQHQNQGKGGLSASDLSFFDSL